MMNIHLTNVISDITGVTGMQIIRAIVAGEHDPAKLAQFRDYRCKSSEDQVAKALEGNYRPEHIFALQQTVELYDFYNQQLMACDAEIEKQYTAFQPQVDVSEQPLLSKKISNRRKPNHPAFDLQTQLYKTCGVDLTDVDGIDVLIAQDIIAEIGLDMNKWPTSKHFASWLRLCPHNDMSRGKILKSKAKKTKNRANHAFHMAAQAVSRSDSALGAFYRRIRAKHGVPKAITATAHKIARTVYHMLKNKQPYQDPGQNYYMEQYQQRVLKNLQRKARKLGMQLIPNQPSGAKLTVS
jgi:transposase